MTYGSYCEAFISVQAQTRPLMGSAFEASCPEGSYFTGSVDQPQKFRAVCQDD